MDRFSLDDLRGRRVYWLLDVHAFGQIIRLSTSDLLVAESATGAEWRYTGTLPGADFSSAVALLQDNLDAGGLQVEAVLPVDVPSLLAKGHQLEGARAELSRWVDGTDYSDRRVMLEGRVQESETGADGEAVAFSVAEHVWEASTLIPGALQIVDGINWPDSITSLFGEELGLSYPIVFGYPGITGAVDRGWITGSQGVWVDHRRTGGSGGNYDDLKLVIAGHRVTADRVMLSTDGDIPGHRFVVHHMTDGRGQTVAYVDAEAVIGSAYVTPGGDSDSVNSYGLGASFLGSTFQPENATISTAIFSPVFCGWYLPAAATAETTGGMRGSRGQLVRGAGDVLESLFSFVDRPVDRGRFAAAAGQLNRFKIDAVIDARVRPWDWFSANLRPILPVSMVTGPAGVYPIVWAFDATAADAVAHLDATNDPTITRASRLQVDTSGIVNDFSMSYALSLRTGEFYRQIRLSAGPFSSSDPLSRVSLHCQLSQSRYRYADGRPRVISQELESSVIYDDSTAAAILGWRARAYALGQVFVSYVVPYSGWGWLDRGQVVTITDPEVHVSARVALVVDIQIDSSETMGIKLLLLEDPPRDARG